MEIFDGNLNLTGIEMANLVRAAKKQLKKDKITAREWRDFGIEHEDEAKWAAKNMAEYYEERVQALESTLGKLEAKGFK